MIKAIDISKWQGKIDWAKVPKDIAIVLIRASHGLKKDERFDEYKKGARSIGAAIGYYHYAEGNDVQKEVDFFLKSVGDIAKGECLALDFEIHLDNSIVWCNSFVEKIQAKVGFWPFFYSYVSIVNLFIAKTDSVLKCPLWVSDPNGAKTPRIGNWPLWSLWQWTNLPKGGSPFTPEAVDQDWFNGKVGQFKALGKQATEQPAPATGYVIYNQLNYKGVKFGSKKLTDIGRYGCKLCAAATIAQIEPVTLDKILVNGGAYFGGNGDMLDDTTMAKILGWEYFGVEKDINKMPDWSPTIKEVDYSAAPGKQQHFVVRIIRPDGVAVIQDPLGGVERKAAFYSFVTYRKFKIPAPKEVIAEPLPATPQGVVAPPDIVTPTSDPTTTPTVATAQKSWLARLVELVSNLFK